MVTTHALSVAGVPDILITDLPGELHDPPPWEDITEAPCPVCSADCTPQTLGLCGPCLDRLPRVGGCGLALALVAGFTPANAPAVLLHLMLCGDCCALFLDLGRTAEVAQQESTYAARLAINAA
jgi:hypothetical protein